MASSSLPPPDGWGPFSNLGFTEWFLGAAWACGLFVAGFAWRLATKVAVLDRDMKAMDNKIDDRHEQNRKDRSELLDELKSIRSLIEAEMRQNSARVDALYRLMARQKDSD